jgi:hypothetical protein
VNSDGYSTIFDLWVTESTAFVTDIQTLYTDIRLLGIAIPGFVFSASSCERNWGDYKWIRNKKRNSLLVGIIEKLVHVHSILLLSRDELSMLL